MSQTRNTGYLTNIVQYTSNGSINFVSGSTTLLSISSSGEVTTTGVISGSNALSSSYALNAGLLNGLASSSFASASTFNTVSQSFASTSGSISSRVTLIEGQYATTGSNIFSGTQRITETSNANGFTSTASLYTDGGLRVAKDSYVSGTAYFNNVTIYGTQSVEYITSSQLNISDNIITVNTFTPAVRYGGLGVYDSGSTGLSGSMLWDSLQNRWIYSNPSGSSYDGGMIISGPRNTTGLGNEQGTLSNYITKGQGGDHITSSQITDDGTSVQIPGNLKVTGSALYSANVQLTGDGYVYGNTTAGSSTIRSGIRLNSTDQELKFFTSDAGRLTISSTGAATFSGITQVGVAGNGFVRMQPGTSTQAGYYEVFKGDGSTRLGYIGYDNTNFALTAENSANFTLSGGNVGIGTSNPSTSKLQIAGDWDYNTTNNVQLTIQGATNNNQILRLGYSTTGDFGYIAALVSGTAYKPLVLQPSTGGNVIVGTTADSGYKFQVKGDILFDKSDGTYLALAYNTSVKGYLGIASQIVNGGSANDIGLFASNNLYFATGGSNTQRIRIESNGTMKLYNADYGTPYAFSFKGTPGGIDAFAALGVGTNGNNMINFFNSSNTYVASIAVNASTVSYGTGSDYRIKKNFKDFNGLEKLSAIKVYNFEFKEGGDKMEGVIAHELQEIVPYAVNGVKDEIDSEGNPKIQNVDYSKLVPILVKAIQELKAEIETLKNK